MLKQKGKMWRHWYLKLPNRFRPTFGEWIGVGISNGNFPKTFFPVFEAGTSPDEGFGGHVLGGDLLKSGLNLKKLRSEVSWGRLPLMLGSGLLSGSFEMVTSSWSSSSSSPRPSCSWSRAISWTAAKPTFVMTGWLNNGVAVAVAAVVVGLIGTGSRLSNSLDRFVTSSCSFKIRWMSRSKLCVGSSLFFRQIKIK